MNTLLDTIKEIESLLWGVIIVVGIYIILKYYFLPKLKLNHERQMKKEAFDREKEWADFNNLKESTDEALKQKVEDLSKKNKELEKELESEKKSKELLDKQLKTYGEIFAKLNVEVKPKENKQ